MTLWKLTPVDLKDPNWEASSHRGMAIVRADSEDEAREVAEKAFGVKTRFNPGDGPRFPPWKRPNLVTAERTDDERFDADGPPELLYPPVE